MSILIRGMKMPKGCDNCKFKYRHQGAYVVDYCFPYMKCVDPWTFGRKMNGDKPDWCPLVEIPPHGRLIDADALIDDLEHDVRNDERVIAELKGDLPDGFIDINIATTQDDKDIKQNCIVLLREQPTIIEAEGVKK